jgi:predicted kinase
MSVKKPELWMAAGLPESGITEWAMSTGHPVVSPDALRTVIHGTNFRKTMEPFIWATAKIMVATLFEAGHEVVVLDAPIFSERNRKQWFDTRWDRRCFWFDVPVEVCKERAIDRGREDLLQVLDRMADHFDVPSAEREGFVSVQHFSE